MSKTTGFFEIYGERFILPEQVEALTARVVRGWITADGLFDNAAVNKYLRYASNAKISGELIADLAPIYEQGAPPGDQSAIPELGGVTRSQITRAVAKFRRKWDADAIRRQSVAART